jgi:hypothetical protein
MEARTVVASCRLAHSGLFCAPTLFVRAISMGVALELD